MTLPFFLCWSAGRVGLPDQSVAALFLLADQKKAGGRAAGNCVHCKETPRMPPNRNASAPTEYLAISVRESSIGRANLYQLRRRTSPFR